MSEARRASAAARNGIGTLPQACPIACVVSPPRSHSFTAEWCLPPSVDELRYLPSSEDQPSAAHDSESCGRDRSHEPVDIWRPYSDQSRSTSKGRQASVSDPASQRADAQAGAFGGLG